MNTLPRDIHRLLVTYVPQMDMCAFAHTSKYYDTIIRDLPLHYMVIDNTLPNMNICALLNRYSLEKVISLDITRSDRLTRANWEHLGKLTNLQHLDLLECNSMISDDLIHLRVFGRLQSLYLGRSRYITEDSVRRVLNNLIELSEINIDVLHYHITDESIRHLINLTQLNCASCPNITD